MTKNAQGTLLIHLQKENYFLVTKCHQLTIIHLFSGHLANELFTWDVYFKLGRVFQISRDWLICIFRYSCITSNLSTSQLIGFFLTDRLHLKMCKSPHSWVSWIWSKSLWWWGWSPEALNNIKYTYIAITPRFTLTQSGSTF